MFNVADYFKKFAKIEGETLAQSDAIKAALYEHCGIDKAKFEVKKGIIYISGSSMLKSAVYMKKAAILAALRAGSQAKITDIR